MSWPAPVPARHASFVLILLLVLAQNSGQLSVLTDMIELIIGSAAIKGSPTGGAAHVPGTCRRASRYRRPSIHRRAALQLGGSGGVRAGGLGLAGRRRCHRADRGRAGRRAAGLGGGGGGAPGRDVEGAVG